MTLHRLTPLTLLAALSLAACSGEKVKPDDAAGADSTALTPEQREAKEAEVYRKTQEAFADSVLKSSSNARQVAEKLGKAYAVGSIQLRDSLLKYVEKTPQCFKDAKDVDPYLAGTVTFYIHMSVVGSDVVRVQESQWTSQAGNFADKCFNEQARAWKFPMGSSKPGNFLLQVQFK